MNKYVLPVAVGAAFAAYYFRERLFGHTPVASVATQQIQSTPMGGGSVGPAKAPMAVVAFSPIARGVSRSAPPPSSGPNGFPGGRGFLGGNPIPQPPPPPGSPAGQGSIGAKDYVKGAAGAAAAAACTSQLGGAGALAAPLCGQAGAYLGGKAYEGGQYIGQKAEDAANAVGNWVSGLF